MKLYTTYFAKVKCLPDNICPISIALKDPNVSFLNSGRTYKRLAPPWYILKKYKENNDQDQYIADYKKNILMRQNPDDIVRALCNIAEGKDIALVCYERPEKFCHRHLVAEWLNQNGYHVEEWDG